MPPLPQCAEAINAVIPDMSVALADTGQVAQAPWNWLGGSFDIDEWTLAWIKKSETVFCEQRSQPSTAPLTPPTSRKHPQAPASTRSRDRANASPRADAFHPYLNPGQTTQDVVQFVRNITMEWNVPSFATEFGGCDVWEAMVAAGISHSYWHYSCYCTTGPSFGNRRVPEDTFGGCKPPLLSLSSGWHSSQDGSDDILLLTGILGWGSGNSEFRCPPPPPPPRANVPPRPLHGPGQ